MTVDITDRPSIPSAYVDDQANWVLLSNAQWRAGTAHVRVLQTQPVLVSSLTEKSSVVWAPTCSRGAQQVELTRQVDLPGPPSMVEFNLYPEVFVGASSVPVFKSVELLVNGHTALDVPGASLTRPNILQLKVPASANQWFRFGENTLDVRVTKGVSKTSSTACNRSPTTSLGVAFGLRGTSSADLSVSAGKAPVQYVRGSVYGFNGVFTVHNAGPSAAIGGTFTFGAQLGFLNGVIDTTTHTIKAGAPFGLCTATGGPDSGPLSVTCPFAVFPPGATATISLTTLVKIPADQSPAGVYQIDAGWSIKSFTAGSTYSGTSDPNSANDTYSEFINLCGLQATDPKCPAAGG